MRKKTSKRKKGQKNQEKFSLFACIMPQMNEKECVESEKKTEKIRIKI